MRKEKNFGICQLTFFSFLGNITLTPEYTPRDVVTNVKYLSDALGVDIKSDHVVEYVPTNFETFTKSHVLTFLFYRYLQRMCLPSEVKGDQVIVHIPPTRSDVLGACDVVEDVAIGYGFNKILAIAKPPPTSTSGSQRPLNKFW